LEVIWIRIRMHGFIFPYNYSTTALYRDSLGGVFRSLVGYYVLCVVSSFGYFRTVCRLALAVMFWLYVVSIETPCCRSLTCLEWLQHSSHLAPQPLPPHHTRNCSSQPEHQRSETCSCFISTAKLYHHYSALQTLLVSLFCVRVCHVYTLNSQ